VTSNEDDSDSEDAMSDGSNEGERTARNGQKQIVKKMRQNKDSRSNVAKERYERMKREKAAVRHIEDDELSDDDVPIGWDKRAKHEEQELVKNNFMIKDVEGSLSYFTGDEKLPIENWITEFEDMSALQVKRSTEISVW